MNRIICIQIILLIGLLITCTQEETTPRSYPRVATGEVTDITIDGAVFHGSITYTPGAITDHGFIWSEDALPGFANSETLSLGALTGKGDFQTLINKFLTANKKYYVRAYAKSSNYLVLGDVISFLSLGSSSPRVTNYSPATGELGDTIVIRGKNFGDQPGVIFVKFDTVKANVISISDTLLQVTVPANLVVLSSQISVSVYGNKGMSNTNFTLIPPQITSVDKAMVALCDTLTISTSHLPNDLKNMLVYFGATAVSPFSYNAGKLKVRLPLIQNSSTALKVRYGLHELTLAAPLNVTQSKVVGIFPSTIRILDTLTITMTHVPKCVEVNIDGKPVVPIELTSTYLKVIAPVTIEYLVDVKVMADANLIYQNNVVRSVIIEKIFPERVKFDDIVTISGRGFYPDPSMSVVYFQNHWAGTALSVTSNEIKIAVPRNINLSPDGSASVLVFSATSAVQSNGDRSFSIVAPEITSISPTVITNYSMVTVNGKNFNPDLNYNSLSLDEIGVPMDVVSASSTKLVFTATNSSLSSMNSSPDITQIYASNLSLTVSGQTVTNSSPISISYIGPWTQLNVPIVPNRNYGTSFSFGKKLYYGLGNDAFGNPLKDFWEYDINSDTWTQLADFPGGSRYNATSWVINNLAYVASGVNAKYLTDVWRFDPTSKSWQRLNDFPGNPGNATGVALISNQVYWGFTNNQLWKYDYTKDTWLRLKDTPFAMRRLAGSNTNLYGQEFDSQSSARPLYQYNFVNDSWSQNFYVVAYPGVFFGAGATLYQISNPHGQILNDVTNQVTDINCPIDFDSYFENNGMIYLIGQNVFYRLDPSLYPITP
jgi:hypothetical protein